MRGSGKGEPGRVPTEPTTHLLFHVQPRARQTEIVGWHGEAIKVRVAAPPADGAANEEVLRFLAERLGLPRSQVLLESGPASRRKRVRVTGLAPNEVLTRLRLT